MFLPQTIHDTESQTYPLVRLNCTTPFRLGHADRAHSDAVPPGVFHDRGRSIKSHGLIVQEAGVKLRRTMHFEIRASVGQNRKTDRVRLRKSVERKRRD